MKIQPFRLLLFFFPFFLVAQTTDTSITNRITSVIDSSDTKKLVLKQSFEVEAPLDSVWNAYTTKRGWESWATPIAEVDFKINGVIKTNYNKDGKIGDDSTVTLHVLNYLQKKMITLQAELTKHFPVFMKENEKDLYNLIFFEEITPTKTKIVSYGIGYKNNEKYKSLMKFFIKGNEASYNNLISYLETGKPSVNY